MNAEPRSSPIQLLSSKKYTRICAPMVRYSRLPFRLLVKEYDVDLVFTPMILSDVFIYSDIARSIEYQTNFDLEDNVIVQFAANDPKILSDATEMVARNCNGIDINCGCPQKWAIQEGIGSALMKQPELVSDMIQQVKARTAPVKMSDGSSFPVSIKIRCVSKDPKTTVEFAKRAEMAGADFITLHGRTKSEKSSEPVDLESIKIVKESLNIPVVANGDIFNLSNANETYEYTRADGIMSARGLLENPSLFSGYEYTPIEAVQRYVDLSLDYGTDAFIFHQHIMQMMSKQMTRGQKRYFNCLLGTSSVLEYLETYYGVSPREYPRDV